MESWLFTTDCLDCVCCKNQSLLIASVVVLALKALPNSAKIMSWLSDKGINLGVTIISITILVPIATGQIGLKDLIQSFKTPMGWLGILCGILVAVLSSKGVGLINQSPEITVALVLERFLASFLKGIAAGPIIASGMMYVIITTFQVSTLKQTKRLRVLFAFSVDKCPHYYLICHFHF